MKIRGKKCKEKQAENFFFTYNLHSSLDMSLGNACQCVITVVTIQ